MIGAVSESAKMWEPLRQKVRKYMRDNRINQAEVARRAGVSRSLLSNFLGKRKSGADHALFYGLSKGLFGIENSLYPKEITDRVPPRDKESVLLRADSEISATELHEEEARDRLVRLAEDIFVALGYGAQTTDGRKTGETPPAEAAIVRGRGESD